MCANYDHEYGCLALDSTCYMFGIAYNRSALCKYFRSSVLPLNPELERILADGVVTETKPCKICGKQFALNGRQAYCSEKCFTIGRRKSVAENVREYRKRKKGNVIN